MNSVVFDFVKYEIVEVLLFFVVWIDVNCGMLGWFIDWEMNSFL